MSPLFWFENFLKNLSTTIITNTFFFILLAILGLGFLTFLFRNKSEKCKSFSEYSPILLTSLGILGTFTGVVAGLLNFDVNNIDGSITTLLGGMKTAFLTSVIGIFFSILLKIIYTLLTTKQSQEKNEEIDIISVVNKIHLLANNSSNQINVMQQISDNIFAISNGLNNETENSLLGQIRLLRTDLLDNTKQLKNELTPMIANVENMAKSLGSDGEHSILGQVRLLRTDLLDNAKQFKNELTPIIDNIKNIATSLSAECENSVLGQITLLRADLADNDKKLNLIFKNLEQIHQSMLESKTIFDQFETKLWHQLADFSEMMSKSATEAVIQALKQVIQDFNHNLTEQFGDNFKQLNQAVIALIDWQENYKNQLNEMITLYNAGVQSLTVTENSIAKIEGSTQVIPTTMEKLSNVITTNQQQIDNLGNHLSTFAELRDKAVQALPEIQNQISSMLNNMEKGNSELLQSIKIGSEKLAESFVESGKHFSQTLEISTEDFAKKTQKSNELLVNNAETIRISSQEIKGNLETTTKLISDHQKVINQEFKQMAEQVTQFTQKWQNEFDLNTRQIQERLSQSIDEMMKKQLSENTRLMTRLEEENKKALATTGESVEKQLKLIDTSMETELKRVMEQMGISLATISRKFTDDYKELVNRMIEITNYRGR